MLRFLQRKRPLTRNHEFSRWRSSIENYYKKYFPLPGGSIEIIFRSNILTAILHAKWWTPPFSPGSWSSIGEYIFSKVSCPLPRLAGTCLSFLGVRSFSPEFKQDLHLHRVERTRQKGRRFRFFKTPGYPNSWIVYMLDGRPSLYQIGRKTLIGLLNEIGPGERRWKILRGGQYENWMTLIPVRKFIGLCSTI